MKGIELEILQSLDSLTSTLTNANQVPGLSLVSQSLKWDQYHLVPMYIIVLCERFNDPRYFDKNNTQNAENVHCLNDSTLFITVNS